MRAAAGFHHAYLARHFERRRKATLKGLHLPSEDELLLGMGFLNGDVFLDAKEACIRWHYRLNREPQISELTDIKSCVDGVTVSPDATSILLLYNTLSAHLYDIDGLKRSDNRKPQMDSLHLRCQIYLAHLDMPGAARDIAFEAMVRLVQTDRDNYKFSVRFAYSALAWGLYSINRESRQEFSWSDGTHISPIRQDAGLRLLIEDIIDEGVQDRVEEERRAQIVSYGGSDTAVETEPSPTADPFMRVVLREIGNAEIAEGRKIASAFKPICGTPLRLTELPDLVSIRADLNREAPHALEVTNEILNGMINNNYAYIPPTILVGKPGCGKTRYARRLLELLGVEHQIISCGGVADGNWGGTARRWSTGEPSIALSALLRTKTANPGIILDEIEKVGTDRNNGNAAESILAMLEPETAARYIDPYVQGECDISAISWIMTANELRGIQGPFRDRCRVIRFPAPKREHGQQLANTILKDQMKAQGLEPAWFSELEDDEIGTINKLWRGGSLRRLQKLVQGVVRARIAARTIH